MDYQYDPPQLELPGVWIPVDDGLPQETGQHITFNKAGFLSVDKYENGWRSVVPKPDYEVTGITHWYREDLASRFAQLVRSRGLANRLKEHVEEKGKERTREHGRGMAWDDYLMGAATALSFSSETVGLPAITWVFAIIGNQNPLDPEGKYEKIPHNETRRNEWLVLATTHDGFPYVAGAFTNEYEAQALSERMEDTGASNYSRTPFPGYVSPQAIGKLEIEDEDEDEEE